jgi:hypothetical protein
MNVKKALGGSLFVLAVVSFSSAKLGLAAESDEKAVKSAAAGFYAALNKMFAGDSVR